MSIVLSLTNVTTYLGAFHSPAFIRAVTRQEPVSWSGAVLNSIPGLTALIDAEMGVFLNDISSVVLLGKRPSGVDSTPYFRSQLPIFGFPADPATAAVLIKI